jgi:hypothetical protein
MQVRRPEADIVLGLGNWKTSRDRGDQGKLVGDKHRRYQHRPGGRQRRRRGR